MTTAAENKQGSAGSESPPKSAGQKPSPCRIVLYNLEKHDTISHHMGVDGKLKITQAPAMVMFVNPDGTLRLSVFQQFGGASKIVPQAEFGVSTDPNTPAAPGTWQWPPRV